MLRDVWPQVSTSKKHMKVDDMKVDMVADIKVDMVADMKVDMVVEMKVYMVADMKWTSWPT